jgi:hypothetical protein
VETVSLDKDKVCHRCVLHRHFHVPIFFLSCVRVGRRSAVHLSRRAELHDADDPPDRVHDVAFVTEFSHGYGSKCYDNGTQFKVIWSEISAKLISTLLGG